MSLVKPNQASLTSEGTLLGGRVKYKQMVEGHRSGFEPVLLAAAIPARPGDRVLEAGAGAGAGLLCLAERVPGVLGVGLEIDNALAALAAENFVLNGRTGCRMVCADAARPPFGRVFDHVFGNPPWHDAGGTASPDGRRALAHRAAPGLLEVWIAALGGVLKPEGSLSLILPASSLAAAIGSFNEAGLTAVTCCPLWPRLGRPAGQIILRGRRRGAVRLLPGLVLHDDDGITAAAQAMLRDGAVLLF